MADRAADIWAIGVILFCMIFGQYPFSGDSKSEMIKAVVHKEPDFPKNRPCTSAVKDLITKMLDKNHSNRI
jgi:serine/threonine protein kinase